mgnify:FL=1|jgi:hypothetical protein
MNSTILANAKAKAQLKDPYIKDVALYYKWTAIRQHLPNPIHDIRITQQKLLIVNKQFLLAGKKQKMRLVSYLDWVHYTPKTLAFAIETNQVEDYYWYQMGDPKSDPNIWKDINEEYQLKKFYALRAGRTYP